MAQDRASDSSGAPTGGRSSTGRGRHDDHPVPRDEPAEVVLPAIVKLIFVQLPNNTTEGHVNGPVGSVEFWVQEGDVRRPAGAGETLHTYANGSLEIRPVPGQELHLLSTVFSITPIDSLAGASTERGADQRLAALGYELHDDHLLNVFRFQLDHDERASGLYTQHIGGSTDTRTHRALDRALEALAAAFPISE